jgi:L-malate glycosyltransferase
MKICYLANATSIHTAKWVNHFCQKGHEVEIISFEQGANLDPRVVVHVVGRHLPLRIQYVLYGRFVRRLLARAKPDIVHAHYGSGYGSLGRLARFHPFVLSVWGSDVFDFPNKSPLHRELFRKNVQSADRVCSTSNFMAREMQKYCSQPVFITPFGVDCDHFRPLGPRSANPGEVVVGTVKSLEPKYGIEYLIRAFARVAQKYRARRKLRLVIAGDGSLRDSLGKLASNLGIDNQTEFLGNVPYEKVPQILSTFSVFAALSIADSETFGVAVVEASACGIPVVVTAVGGLPESVRDRKTGVVVPARDVDATALALEELIDDEGLRLNLGAAGREFVLKNYEWSENASRMERVYESVLTAG